MKVVLLTIICLVMIPFSDAWSYRDSDYGDTPNMSYGSASGIDFPIDCPGCEMSEAKSKKGSCGGNSPQMAGSSFKKSIIDPADLWDHVEEIRDKVLLRSEKSRDFGASLQNEKNRKLILCMWKNESNFNMRAVACTSSAGGIGQVIKATGEDVHKKEGNPCKGVEETKWMSERYKQSSRAQVFLSLCVLFDKANGGTITKETFKRYYGADSSSKADMSANNGLTQDGYLGKLYSCIAKGGYIGKKGDFKRDI